MNCLLLEPEEFDPDTCRAQVVGRRRKHADEILKSSPGDILRVGLIGGRLGRAEILSLDTECLDLRVEFDRDPPPKRALTLVLALPRPPVFRRLLSTIASLGVARLLVVGTSRTEKSFWQSHVVESDQVRERLLLGLEQARDSILPSIEAHRYFEGLVNEVLPPLLAQSRGLIAHPGAKKPCPHAVDDAVTLFVGPEGGLVDYEVERLQGIGFESVHLGERVLRVEPVVPLLVGRLFS
jgi:RsmE family RNA methyltransferase